MNDTMRLGVLGCGDFLRWQESLISGSKKVHVTKFFDPDFARASAWASKMGGTAAKSAEEILDDPEVDMVALFVPPWVRKAQMLHAAAVGKQIITTKPLAPNPAEAREIVAAVDGKVRCGVLYSRSNDSWMMTVSDILRSGKYGQLALYRQDWMHHYPQWNNWALDPEKNGGPFMDAMIHNLNAARHLMGRPITGKSWFSQNLAHPELRCADTESMTLSFEDRGAALLFITWAADLESRSKEGNDREHIDLFYLVTSQGWRITKEWQDGSPVVRLSKEGKHEIVPAIPIAETVYDRFVGAIRSGGANPSDLPDVRDALVDIELCSGKLKVWTGEVPVTPLAEAVEATRHYER